MRGLALGLACLALLFAGCGDDDEPSTDATAAPGAGTTQYRADAQAIVTSVVDARNAALNAPDSEYPSALQNLAATYSRAAKQMEQLLPPTRAKDVHEDLIENFERAAERTSRMESAEVSAPSRENLREFVIEQDDTDALYAELLAATS